MILPRSNDPDDPTGFGITEVEIQETIERLRNLARNRIAQGKVDITIDKFVIGEDLETGLLAIDIIAPLMKRSVGRQLERGRIGRRTFMMVSREGDISVKLKDRHLLKDLSYQMILDELANI